MNWLVVIVLAGLLVGNASGADLDSGGKVLGRWRGGTALTESSLFSIPRERYVEAPLPLFSWTDTNRLVFEVSACLWRPATNLSLATARDSLNRMYDNGVRWWWKTLLLNQALTDAELAGASPALDELSHLANLVAEKDFARRELVYERSPSLSDEAYRDGWREFYAKHRPRYPKESVESSLPRQVEWRQKSQNSNYRAIQKLLEELPEPSLMSVSNRVWQEARAALVTQKLRGIVKSPPEEFINRFIEAHANRYRCQHLVTTNAERAGEWLLAARQAITTNAGLVSLAEIIAPQNRFRPAQGEHTTSLTKLREAFGPEFDTVRLPRAYSIALPHPSALASESFYCSHNPFASQQANWVKFMNAGKSLTPKVGETLVLIVGPAEAVKREEVIKLQDDELREFVALELTRQMTERIRSKFEWLNTEFFPDEKAMRELLFDRDMVWALRGLEY